MIERKRDLPHLTMAGLAVIGGAIVGDVVAHAAGLALGSRHLAHGAVFAGMVLVLLGVVADGVFRAHLSRASQNVKGDPACRSAYS